MELLIKRAAQYLIAAESSFLPENRACNIALSFCLNYRNLCTRNFTSNADQLIFHYDSWTLQWKSNRGIDHFSFREHEHFEIVRWIETQAILAGISKPYVFERSLPNSKAKENLLDITADMVKLQKTTDRNVLIQLEIDKPLAENSRLMAS